MKLGVYYIPDIKLSEIFKIISKIYEEKINSEQGLATILGHRNAESGTFQAKINTLKNLELVTTNVLGLKLTERAEKIVAPKDPMERGEGYKEVLGEIPLFTELQTRLGRGNVVPANFWVHLFEITKIEKAKAQAEAGRVRNIYIDAMKYLSSSSEATSDITSDVGDKQMEIGTLQQDYIEIRTKDAVVKIPHKLEAIRKVKRILEMEEEDLKEEDKLKAKK